MVNHLLFVYFFKVLKLNFVPYCVLQEGNISVNEHHKNVIESYIEFMSHQKKTILYSN